MLPRGVPEQIKICEVQPMGNNKRYYSRAIIFIFLLFFLLFINGCDEQQQEKFEDYRPWWLESDQQPDNEVYNDVLAIQEN